MTTRNALNRNPLAGSPHVLPSPGKCSAVIFTAVLMSASSLLAGATDELQWLKDGAFTWELSNAWSNRTDHAIGAIPAHGVGDWVDGSWAYINGNISTRGNLDSISVYGLNYIKSGTRVVSIKNNGILSVGAGGIVLSAGSLTSFFKLAGPYYLDLACDQTWTCNGASTARALVLQKEVNIRSQNDATLTLSEYFNLRCENGCTFGGNLVVRDHARLYVTNGCSFGANRITLKGPFATLEFSGETGGMATEFALADGGMFAPTGQTWTSTTLYATGNGTATNVLSGRLVVPSGDFSVNVAAGAVLRIAGDVVDDSGNLVPVVNEGAGTLIRDAIIVTDTPVAAGTFAVNEGEEVRVYGNGLGADVNVAMNGGKIVLCKDGITVAAPITLNGDAELGAAEDVTGTFAGAISTGAGVSGAVLYLRGAGCKVFTGGADIASSSAFRLEEGDVLVTNCTWRIMQGGAVCDSGLFLSAGTMTIRDGGFVTTGADDNDNEALMFSINAAGGHGILDIGPGGEMYFNRNKRFSIGATNYTHGTLRISGGYLHDRYANTAPTFAHAGTSTGTFEFVSGRLKLASAIRSGTGTARMAWRGGEWSFSEGYFNKHMLTERTNIKTGGPSQITVDIEGPDCVLDIGTAAQLGVVTNTLPGSTYPWCSTSGGLLTITNSVNDMKIFAVDSVFTNMNVRLATNVTLQVNETAPGFSFGTYEPACGVTAANVVTEDGSVVTADTIRVTSGTVFDTHGYDTWSYDNLTFLDGAVLKFGVNGDMASTLTLPGTLTLPDELSYFAYKDTGISGGTAAVIGCGAISGSPGAVTRVAGSRRVNLVSSGSSLVFTVPGLVMSVR